MLICALILSKLLEVKFKKKQEAYDSLSDFTEENFTGIHVIKAFVKEQQQIRAFAKIARHTQNTNVKFTFVSVLFDVIIEVIIALVNCLIIGFGGYVVYRTWLGDPLIMFGNEITLNAGDLVKFFGYYSSLIWPLYFVLPEYIQQYPALFRHLF